MRSRSTDSVPAAPWVVVVVTAGLCLAGTAHPAHAQSLDDPLAIALTELAQERVAEASPLGPILAGHLSSGESRFLDVPVRRDRCYIFLAVGGESNQDIDLHLYGGGIEVAADTEDDSRPVVPWCNAIFDRVSLEVRMYAGGGRYAVQVYEAESPNSDPLVARLNDLSTAVGEGWRPAAPTELGVLAEGGQTVFDLALVGDRDYLIVAVGSPDVGGLDLELLVQGDEPLEVEPSRLDRDAPSLQLHTPSTGGIYPLRVTLTEGRGEFGVRVYVR